MAIKQKKSADVMGNAFKPKIVNNGDVWGKGNDWFTFYCGNCGVQISSRTKTCEGQFYQKGCGFKIDWD